MQEDLPKRNITNSAVFVYLLVVIFTGLHGIISICLLMLISRLKIGRDLELKHGVTSGNSRLGGIAIIFSILSGIIISLYLDNSLLLSNLSNHVDNILLFSILVGLVGLMEDLNQNLTSLFRLLVIIIVIAIALAIMPQLIPLDLAIFIGVNEEYRFLIYYLFTVLMVSGFVNAGNIVDGANGLFSTICMIFFIVCGFINPSILYISLTVSLLTFTIYNSFTGRIFLGDFGAYFLSAMIAFSSLNTFMNYDVSVFLFASILVYPCFELSRSLLFRAMNRVSIMSPDNNHLHNFMNQYLLSLGFSAQKSNSMTGLSIAIMTSCPPLCMILMNFKKTGDYWFYLLLLQLSCLSIIYVYLSKIVSKKT